MLEYRDRIVAVRKHFGRSQKEMAASCGVSNSTWQNYEAGTLPKPEVLKLLSEHGISADWVLTGYGTMLQTTGQDAPAPLTGIQLDAELMQNCVQAIEELLSERNLELAPEKKGRLVVVFYEYSLSLGRVDRKAARDMIGLAA